MPDFAHVPLETPFLETLSLVGIVSEGEEARRYLQLYAAQADRVLQDVRESVDSGETSADQAADFQQLLVDACAWILCHPVVAGNKYLERFSQGVTLAQARHELQQFSVFGLQFDVAQARRDATAL